MAEGPRETITQELEHDPETGRPGDCLRASVASLLGLGLAEVPHFVSIEFGRPDDDPRVHAWWWSLIGWCASLEPAFDVVPIDTDTWPQPDDPDDPLHGCYLLTGPSPRGPLNHTVVARAGVVVWDPHPSRAGLAGPPVAAERLVRRLHPAPTKAEAAPCGGDHRG